MLTDDKTITRDQTWVKRQTVGTHRKMNEGREKISEHR